MSFQPTLNSTSPWGKVQHLSILAPGIVSVSTASHGGIWLSPDRERRIPPAGHAIARQYAPAQWYEEDCDACIVAVCFAAELSPEFVAHAREHVAADPRMAPIRPLLTREGGVL